jgi:hypothetical protein
MILQLYTRKDIIAAEEAGHTLKCVEGDKLQYLQSRLTRWHTSSRVPMRGDVLHRKKNNPEAQVVKADAQTTANIGSEQL